MSNGTAPTDPRWGEVLSLAAHEYRTPVSVILGYLKMLLKDGNLSDLQRHMLNEIEKSATKMTGFCRELSLWGAIERGEHKFNQSSAVALGALIAGVVASLPPPADGREITIALADEAPGASLKGDPARLTEAFGWLLFALRRELVTSTELLVRLRPRTNGQRPAVGIAIADRERIDIIETAGAADLVTFDEWRGGVGLGLPIARRVVNAHGGSLWSLADAPRATALIELPLE
jgi:signal transduction histidine kinase